MLSMHLAATIAADRTRAGQASRLAALVRCCRPSNWRRAASGLRDVLTARLTGRGPGTA